MLIMKFDISLRSQIQSEENGYKGRYKVQTRRGSPARIICWDKKDPESPIVALVEDYSIENELSYRNDGMYYPGSVNIESNADLFLVDTWEPKFELWDRIVRKGNQEITFDVVSINYAVNNYGVVSDCPYADICRVAFDEQDCFELVKPVSGFSYNEGLVLRCAEGPNKGSLWLRCWDKLVKSDGVTFSPVGIYTEGLYYSANRKETDMFFKELDENGYIWNPEKRKIEKKEPELTDFEREVRDIVTSAFTVTSEDGSCSFTIAVNDETAREIAAGINKLVTKKLFSGQAIE